MEEKREEMKGNKPYSHDIWLKEGITHSTEYGNRFYPTGRQGRRGEKEDNGRDSKLGKGIIRSKHYCGRTGQGRE